ncbi:MAG TPA: molybdopterin cofactor-binding domain-containing protein [Candidatus Tumulicola sp.]|nr:molybdopterin cofactor-binding domain-containing protein [Candidatus Tumulicola sp.]
MAFTTMVGARIKRREDPRLITGRATYVDDVKLVGMLHAAFVRSPYAHAKIGNIDTAAAKKHPGVAGVFTAKDMQGKGMAPGLPVAPQIEGLVSPDHFPLTTDEVNCLGEGVAVVVATDPYVARDAAELVKVSYTPLPVVVDLEKAAAGAPYVHDHVKTNIAFSMPFVSGDVDGAFKAADVVVKERIVNQRLLPSAIEPRACIGSWDRGMGTMTLWSSTQIPHILRTQLALTLSVPETKMRVIAPEVGGGFGSKLNVYADEAIVCWLSRALGKPVKYVETRTENHHQTTHGRDQIQFVEVAAKKDGTVLGLRVKILANMGAYHQVLTPAIPTLTVLMLSGPYAIKNIAYDLQAVFTNTMSTDAYRGAGRPEATFLLERAMDLLARELKLDPAEVRRKNFIPSSAFPYTTATGLTYDTGDYPKTLDKVLELSDYKGLRAQQKSLREQGRYLGIGVSTYVEVCGFGPSMALPAPGWESATIRVEPTGSVTVMTGTSPHGQGEETTFAQIVGDRLGVPIESVNVVHGDTDRVQYGVGIFGSRGTAVGGAALWLAIDSIQEKAKLFAAHAWEANPADVEWREGKMWVRGDDSRSMTIGEVAFAAFRADKLPPGVEPFLDATRRFEPANFVYPFGAHICVVEVDKETGDVKLVKYFAVDDCGKVINPMIVDGQLHGGIAQGIGQALFEEAVYDEDGQLLTGTFMNYAVPHAEQMIDFELARTVTPTDVNPLGVKGIGEAGTIGSTPAVANAVIDALAPFGVKHLDMPLKPEKVWKAMQRTGDGKP